MTSLRHLPNCISVVRIMLVYPVAMTLLNRQYGWTLGLFLTAGLSDALDGYLARRFDWSSRLGSFLDPIADKLLLVTSFLACGYLGLLPAGLVGIVVLRDLLIVTGGVAYFLLAQPFEGQPLPISKLNTFCQLGLILGILVDQGLWEIPEILVQLGEWVVVTTTLASGIQYVWVWGSRYAHWRNGGQSR